LDVFPAEYTGVISGDHSSIIQPRDVDADSYRELRRHVIHAIELAKAPETDDDSSSQGTSIDTEEIDDVPALIHTAEQLALQGQNSQAEATFLLASSTGDLDAMQAYSRFQRQQGHLDNSISTSRRVIEKLATAEDSPANRIRRSKVLSTIGISQRNLGKLQNSERSLREAVSAARADGDEVELDTRAYALDNLGLTLMRSADIRGAKSAFPESRSIRERMHNESKLAPSLLNIARILYREGDFNTAERDCEKALDLWSFEKDPANVAATYSLKGEIAFAMGEYASAEVSFGRALDINNDIGRSVSIALTQQQLARTLFMKGDLVGAEAQARKSHENCVSAANVEGRVGAEQILARIASSNGDRANAVVLLEECVTSYRELGNLTGEAWSSFYLAEVLYDLGRNDSGAARLQRAAALADSITNASLRRAVETFQPH
jgi:tetratricopeptide (TPR) repeat protein